MSTDVATPFTFAGALTGAQEILPAALVSFGIGIAFGALAHDKGLSAAEATLMSVTVFSASAQFPALAAWGAPGATIPILAATLAIGLRYILYGAALRPHLRGLSPLKTYSALYFMADSNWILAMRAERQGRWDAAILLGGGVAMCLGWTAGTVAGAFGAGAIGDLKVIGLDVAMPAFFVALLAGAWRGKADVLPCLVGAGTALAAHAWLPTGWHLVVGIIAGAFAGTWRRDG
jgi:4-azaleucine resistance transporter AzlC